MSKTPIALQLYSLRADSAQDFPATIRAVAQMGYEAVEFAGYHNMGAEELRAILDETGLKCAGTHTSLDSISDQNLQETTAFNATFGNSFLIVPGVGPEYQGTRDGALRLAEKLTQASQTAAEFGARVGYHNHKWEFAPLGTSGDIAMELLAANTPPEVIMQFDTGNVQEAGVDPLPFIEQWKSRIATIHLKPFAQNFENYYIGEDDSNWQGIFAALEGGKTQYFIVEQERYPQPHSPQECVARCLKNLRGMGK
ncbi:MAG: sugar phosphate isomerase/epimerase [Armatimonadetes bacterium]|nr:sugar phosphate isomerase/epimerase [Armatimonadota bacterium]